MTRQRNLALRRLLAFLVDYGVMALFVAVISAVGFAIRWQLGVTSSAPTTFQQKLISHAIVFATVIVPIMLYFAVSESSRSRRGGRRRSASACCDYRSRTATAAALRCGAPWW